MHFYLAITVDLVEFGPVLQIISCFLGHVCLIFYQLIDSIADTFCRLACIEVFLMTIVIICISILWRRVFLASYHHLLAWRHIFVGRWIDFQNRATAL